MAHIGPAANCGGPRFESSIHQGGMIHQRAGYWCLHRDGVWNWLQNKGKNSGFIVNFGKVGGVYRGSSIGRGGEWENGPAR